MDNPGRIGKGKLIGNRYEVIRPLGRGGIGKVFLVKDTKRKKLRALKMLRSKYQDNGRAMERFAREVQVVRQMNHSGIVKIFDARRDGELLYYTMEYVEGKSIRAWMTERGTLNFGSTVRVLALVADALQYAHQSTIHRDISPENVMVQADGSIRILDFGLAKLTETNQALTMVGVSLGKLAYVAPEQRISAKDVDHRTDIYPLGVMFHEMLTGKLPDITTRFSELCPDLPKACDDLLAKTLAADPEERYASAGEFRQDLVALYHTYSTPGRNVETPDSEDEAVIKLEDLPDGLKKKKAQGSLLYRFLNFSPNALWKWLRKKK